jgi:mono/diheme cytochrome c family protein
VFRVCILGLTVAALFLSAGAFAQAPLHPGLVATATDGQRTVKFALPTPNFTLLADDSIHPALKPNFKVEWNGVLKLARSGRHTLFADAKVFVDGREIQGQPTPLEAGERALRIEFTRKPGATARLQLQWESEHFAREPVPHTAFGNRELAWPASVAEQLGVKAVSSAPLQEFHRLARQLNCAECHELYGPARRELEGAEAPPSLTDAGNKLRASWLTQVLVNNKRVRPWMKLEPAHHGEAARPLVNLFAQQAGAELGEGATVPPPSPAQAAEGLKLLGKGEGGLGCINCHDFAGHRSAGDLRGPDMTEMHARVRTDWLLRWLHEPSRLQPGTAMPAFFGDMPAAQAKAKMDAIVHALAVGKALSLPEGLLDQPQNYRLLVRDEPVVFRTFIADSSTRSIAVGLPGGVNYVFDAEQCRVRYAWSGEFLDVAKVWTGRGGGQAAALGKRFFTAPAGHPLRIGNPDAEPTVKFRGYRLMAKFPEFDFEVNGVPVRQRVRRAGDDRLEWEFELGETRAPVWVLTGGGVNVVGNVGAPEPGRVRLAPGVRKVTVTAGAK